ncbi:MAG: hypothetical protein GEU99_15425 [Luteitalea sp.]|nr:hypothetical protein [Luteitalea sp.]
MGQYTITPAGPHARGVEEPRRRVLRLYAKVRLLHGMRDTGTRRRATAAWSWLPVSCGCPRSKSYKASDLRSLDDWRSIMGVESSAISRLLVTALLVSGLAVPAIGQEHSGARVSPPGVSLTIGAPQAGQPQPSQTPPPTTPAQPEAPAAPTDQVMPTPGPADQPQPDPNARQLSIDDAVQLALENNLGLKVVRINPLLSDLGIADARSNWTPSVSSNWSYQDAQSPPSSQLEGAQDISLDQTLTGDFGFEQLLPWGTQYRVAYEHSRSESSNFFSAFNPSTRANVSFSFVQPLLQGFRIDGARQSLIVSRMDREITDYQLRNSVISTTRQVRNAYWDFVNARGNLEVARRTLSVSEQQLRDNQKRVEVGTMAPIEVIEAEAEVAQNQSDVIATEAQVEEAEDDLRTLLFDPSSPDYWERHFEPTDEPTVRLEPVDVDSAIKNALANRTDIREARKTLEINDVSVRYAKDQTLPSLGLQVGYQAGALGGTEPIRGPSDNPFEPGPIIGEETRSYSDVLGDVFGLDFPTWSVGVNMSYPIGRSSQDVGLARARLQQRQAQLQIRDLERNVSQEIRTLGRQVNTQIRLVQSTRVARELAEKNLEAAQKRFAVGIINQFEVIQRQRDLSERQFQELDAMTTYAKSVVDFEAAQEGAIFGGGGVTGVGVSPTGGAPTGGTGGAMGGTNGATGGPTGNGNGVPQ